MVVSVCSFCLKTDESSMHLFLRCPFAAGLWTLTGGKLNCTFDLFYVISLLSCILVPCSSQVSDIFVAVVVHTLHIIWISRNSLRFSMDMVSLQAAKVCLPSLVAMSGNHSVGHCLLSHATLLDSSWLKVNIDGLSLVITRLAAIYSGII